MSNEQIARGSILSIIAELNKRDAEIERLREKSERDDKLLYAETEKVYLAEKDNERLRKDVVHWREAHRSCIEAGDILKEEIQRLRNQLCNLDYY